VPGYAGLIHFTSTDGAAVLPPNASLTNGTGSFVATLSTLGTQTITATDTVTASLTGTSGPIQVVVGLATHFSVTAPANTPAGSPISVTVTALDQYGDTVTNYAGTVHFTSTDAAATLPANSTLTSGVGTFSATLATAGTQTITATDTAQSSITGTSGPITVSPGPATHFVVAAPATAVVGTPLSFTVTAKDGYGNIATGYAGTIAFSATDPAATLPASATLTAGVGTFSITFKTPGSQTITATDTATPSITGTSGPIVVSPGVAVSFVVTAPATVTAGALFSFTITAKDVDGNTATGYPGLVNVTNPGSNQILFADVPLHDGTTSLTTRFYTAGTQTIAATDVANASLTGSSNPITVVGGPATHILITAPASTTAGDEFKITAVAEDTYGNQASGYTGTIHFTSTDPQAVLPPDSALPAPTDYTVTLYSIGDQTITATDTVNSSIAGTSGAINVAVNGVHTFPPGLAMISVPADYTGQTLAEVLGYASPLLAVWEPSAGTYAVTPTAPADSLVAGQGYWVRFPATETIATTGTPTPTDAPFTIALNKGWNMIGDPFDGDVALSTVTVTPTGGSPQPLAGSAAIPGPVFAYSGGLYVIATQLSPYEGYWVNATEDCTLSVPAP